MKLSHLLSFKHTARSSGNKPSSLNNKSEAELKFLGLPIANINMAQAISHLYRCFEDKQLHNIAFINADCFNLAHQQVDYRMALNGFDQLYADGCGMKLGAKILGEHMVDNINGTDMLPEICQHLSQTGQRIYFLGGQDKVAAEAAKRLRKQYPGLQIVGCHHGYLTEQQTLALVDEINALNVDLLLVGMGAPSQELWLQRYSDRLNAKVRMAVGGLFDYYSGRIPRAPMWMRGLSLEWVWRTMQEPKRLWRRYLIGNPLFLLRVLLAKQAAKVHALLPSSKLIRMLKVKLWYWTPHLFSLAKRFVDILVSVFTLLLLAPLFVVVALFVCLGSPGPLLYSQTRIGKSGLAFKFWKFRSMYTDAEQRLDTLQAKNEVDGGVIFKMKQDPRVTPIGRVLRKYSLDELPQLWNVLCGDMSLVGPRPALPKEVQQYGLKEQERLQVTPGLTCYWQVSGRSDLSFTQQIALDRQYIYQRSLLTDFRLLFRTIPAVISGNGAY